MTNAPGYLYIIHVREFLRANEPVYKVGRTDNIPRRLSEYPKGSKLIAAMAVQNVHAAETELLHNLCTVCNIRIDMGREYVQGALDTVLQTFWNTVTHDAYRWSSGTTTATADPEPTPMEEDAAAPPADNNAKALKVDPDICVVNFVQARKEQLTKKVVASLWLYQAFLAEAEQQGCYLSHNRFTIALKKHFDVMAKPLRLPEHGLCQALVFDDLNAQQIANAEDLISGFVKEHLVKDEASCVTLKQLKEVFDKSKYGFDGAPSKLKGLLEHALGVNCTSQKKVGTKNITNAFIGYRLLDVDCREHT